MVKVGGVICSVAGGLAVGKVNLANRRQETVVPAPLGVTHNIQSNTERAEHNPLA